MLKPEVVCGDPGRLMFFEHVGHYFAAEPKLKPLPIGTVCPICGSTSARLWKTDAGQAQCLAQNTVTRRRAGRKSRNEPCTPAANPWGKIAFVAGSMAVAGPFVARVVTRVLPDKPIPETITVGYPENGGLSRFIVGLVMNPPKPPFVALVFGKKAGFRSAATVDPSLIRISGPEGFDVPTPIVREWLSLFEGMQESAIGKVLASRVRFARGEIDAIDRDALAELRRLRSEIVSSFRELPGPGTPQAAVLRRILVPKQS
jgi:hypothetical protein